MLLESVGQKRVVIHRSHSLIGSCHIYDPSAFADVTGTPGEFVMNHGIKTVIHPVKDLAAAKAVFSVLLGVEPYMDEPYYVGFSANGQNIGLDPQGHQKGMSGPVSYWHVDDIEASLRALLDAGAQTSQEVKDVGGGKLIASVTDTDGNVIGLIQPA
ncbi:VOC family protein [Nonomuraea sp. B5E05]|uniref:VOC family protein n=1 Tax=Nonomuraea sp. B5E05 TaxID=3153569 RepID=UPI0032614AF5